MHSKYLLLLLFQLVAFQHLTAQHQLPVIKATSDLVDIRDGNDFQKNAWSIVPEARPDVYTSDKLGEKVTFYTDIDSISYIVEKNVAHDFIILLNGKDSAYTQIAYKPSYLDILKAAAAYDENDPTVVPAFTYQSSSAPELVALREGFKLDSIAGTGNEVSRILNLLRWVHELIPHDGNHGNPVVKNAMSLIKTCKKEERGLNCRGLATVLNECYLALDIKSRFITCMPKDSVFQDCHVINMVYSNDLNKWLWIDPTNNAYVMNEKGELLSIEEVRERLINDQPLLLNPDANWNRKESVYKEHYLYYYMAKNLYRLECPLASEYDYETHKPGKKITYVELLPLDGLRQLPKVSERTYEDRKMTYRTIKTNKPAAFWTAPVQGKEEKIKASGKK